MKSRLSDEEWSTLHHVVSARRPGLLAHLDTMKREPLAHEIYDELQSAMGEEFIATGLGAGDEPNARGLMLEEIIDKIGRLRDGDDRPR